MADTKQQEDQDIKEVKIEVVKREGLTGLPTTGALGSVHPDGSSVAAHLYYEHNTIPDATYHPVNEEGVAHIDKGREDKDSIVTRFIHTTLIMSPLTARQIGEWLIRKSEQAAIVRERLEQDVEVSQNGDRDS